MLSTTPEDPGSSNLSLNVLSALRDAVERGGPVEYSQALARSAQQEVSAHQSDLQAAATPAESSQSADQTQRRRTEAPGHDAQPTSISSPASAEAPGPHAAREPEPATFKRAVSDLGNAQPVPPRQQTGPATAQARAPVFTEGSDGTSPYKPHTGQRIGRTLLDTRFQSSQRLPQVSIPAGRPMPVAQHMLSTAYTMRFVSSAFYPSIAVIVRED